MRIIFLLLFQLIIQGCTSAPKVLCSEGRSNLDGTCVNQDVADYVSCIRAYGTELNNKSNTSLSSSLGNIAISGKAASDISNELTKKFTASDHVMMRVVEHCNQALLQPPSQSANKPLIQNSSAIDSRINKPSVDDAIPEVQSFQFQHYKNQRVKSCGKVAQISPFKKGVYLNMDQVYPKQTFTIVIWDSELEKIGIRYGSITNLEKRNLCAKGELISYKGSYQIQVNSIHDLFIE